MIPSFTPVQWAIIGSGLVSTVTLIVVILDFYQSHLVTERSDITLRPSASRDSTFTDRSQRTRFFSKCTAANDGDRSGVVNAKEANISFEPSGLEFSWREMDELEERNSPNLQLYFPEDNSVPAHSTKETSLRLDVSHITRLEWITKMEDSIEISATIDVEDNVGHYQIQYSDGIRLID